MPSSQQISLLIVGKWLTNQFCGKQYTREQLDWTPNDVATYGARLFVDSVWPAYLAQQLAPQSATNARKVSILLMRMIEDFNIFTRCSDKRRRESTNSRIFYFWRVLRFAFVHHIGVNVL